MNTVICCDPSPGAARPCLCIAVAVLYALGRAEFRWLHTHLSVLVCMRAALSVLVRACVRR